MTARGFNRLRRGFIQVDQPAGGAVNSAVTVTGTVVPNGEVVETAWGTDPGLAPATGWGAATAVAGTGGGSWTRTTTRPGAAGTWYLHARIQRRPGVDTPSAAVIVV